MSKLKNVETFKFLSKIVLILYLLLLIWVVVFKCNTQIKYLYSNYYKYADLNIIERGLVFINPLKPYLVTTRKEILLEMLRDEILNVFAFIPLGLYISYFIKNDNFVKVAINTFIFSLLIEFFQLFSLIGMFSTMDLITNTLGGILGYLIYKLIYKESRLIILNVLSIVVIIIAIPLTIYAIINTINNIDVYLDLILKRI
ncbi:MAG: VanZ family protein [Clostridia bacterium]|nr:VanZ family protein [Clostridia bacterium]